jgi:PAS domain S-box-containing protein
MKEPLYNTVEAQPIHQFEPSELLQYTDDALIATDMNFTVVFFNKSAEAIYGIASADILNKPLDACIRYSYCGTTVEKCLDDLNREGHWQGKVSFQHKDGNVIELLANVSFILDEKGNREGIVAINKNVTVYEKQAEIALQSERRMKAMLAGTSESLFLLDSNYKILIFNNNAREFIRRLTDKEFQCGSFYFDLLPGWRHKAVRQALAKAMRGESTEYEVLYPNGLWALVNHRAVVNNYTGEKEICVSVRDISLRKKTEEEVKMLSLLARETVNGVMITDTDSKILWVNTSFVKIYGYKEEEVIGRHPEFLFKGVETDPETLKQIHEQVDAHEHFICELASCNKAGKRLWIRLDMHPILGPDKRLLKYLVMVTDLTEQQLQQKREIRKRIAEQKKINRIILQTQETFSNELARELHDNVNQILTAAKLQIEVGENGGEFEKQYIQKGLGSIEEAIREIRILSKQLMAPRFTDTDLQQEIDSLIENMQLASIVELDERDFDAELSADVSLNIFRIIQEQLKNITKHARASSVSILLKNDDKNVVLSIRDNGIGFDQKQKKVGIGLTNIRNRVESYNGSMEINSEPGKGCRLTVIVPVGHNGG